MKIISIALITFLFLFAEESTQQIPSAFNTKPQDTAKTQDQILDDFEENNEISNNNQMMFLNAIQGSFFQKDKQKTDNSLFIDYKNGEIYNVRLRYAMTTTFVFGDDEIAHIILGDEVGFNAKILGDKKYQISNILMLKPLQIGVDSNLTIIGKSGKIYTFYIFSTTFTNRKNPAISVFVKSPNYLSNFKGNQYPITEKKFIKEESDFRKVNYQAKVFDDEKFLKIGDEVNHLYIEKKKIIKGYKQSPKNSKTIMVLEIFNDGDFTYFKFDRSNAKSKFPVAYKVVDGYDNPVNSKIVGDYLVAEDISDKWTLWLGDEYICIRKEKK